MKKLMFVAAIAASAAAFADPINAIGFGGYGSTVYNGTIGANGQPEYDEAGNEKTALRYFFFDGESNSSVVTNEQAGFIHAKHTANFATATDANYLALDTEGGTLWRSINTISESGTPVEYGLGTAQPVAATGTYLDTLVQFTVTEDEAPTLGAEDKLAIWLQADNGTTNLMVAAGYFDSSDAFVSNKVFALKGVVIQPGEWYRLTVAAIDNIFTDADEAGYRIAAFTIRIDGTVMTTDNEMTVHADAYSGWIKDYLSAEMQGKVEGGSVFLSRIQGETDDQTGAFLPNTLQGVGFQGTGAVDEIVWTEEDPFPAAVVEFTLTYSGDANVTALGAVSYTIGEDPAQTVTFDNNEASIVSNATVTIAAPTFAQGYQLAALTVGGTAVADPVFPYSFTMTANTTVAITAEQIPASYPTYIDTTDTTITAKYDAWKTKVGYDDSTASSHLNQFLLDVDEETTVGGAALEITEIKQNATAGWDITIGCTIDNVGLTGTVGSTIVCNGYLAVSYTDDLAGTWTTENIAVTAVDATTGTVTVNVNKSGAKFMKVTLTAAPQPAANN